MKAVSYDNEPASMAAEEAQPDSWELTHVENAIQPHGVLLALDAAAAKITVASDSSGQVLGLDGKSILGLPLRDVLGHEGCEQVMAVSSRLDALREAPVSIRLRAVTGTEDLVAQVRAVDELLVMEMEPACASEHGDGELLVQARLAFADVRQAQSEPAMAMAAAAALQKISGYDRVVVYRFTPDGYGETVGEACHDQLDSLMEPSFPSGRASQRTLELLAHSPITQIVDARQPPSLLHRHEGSLVPADLALDLSRSVLRYPSRTHRMHLSSKGLRAALELSIVVAGRVWGLVACHHRSPRCVPVAVRELMGLQVRKVAAELALLQMRAELARHRDRQSLSEQVVSLVRAGNELTALALGPHGEALKRLVAADGVAVVAGRSVSVVGNSPGQQEIQALLSWHKATGDEPRLAFFCATTSGVQHDSDRGAASQPRSLLLLPVGTTRDTFILWCRDLKALDLQRADAPQLPSNGTPVLSGRTTFAEPWTTWGASNQPPWSEDERSAAAGLGYLIDTELGQRHASRLQALGAAVASIDDMIVLMECTPQGELQVAYVNDAYVETLGRQRRALQGKGLTDLLGGVGDAEGISLLREGIRISERTHLELRLCKADRTEFWAEVDAVPIVDAHGAVGHWVLVLRDMTSKRLTEAALLESESRFRQIVQHMDEGVLLLAANGEVVSSNESASRLLGWTAAATPARRLDQLTWVHPPTGESPPDAAGSPVARTLETGEPVQRREVGLRLPSGKVRWLVFAAKLLPVAHGSERRKGSVVVSVRDVTQQRAAERALQEQAEIDALTGLGNRKRLYTAIENRLQGDEPGPFAVLLLDLDDFKDVNDQHGHAVGDELLRQMATRLNGVIREGDEVARLGGDEFVILSGRVERLEQVERLGNRVLQAFDTAIQLGDLTMRCSGSVGVAIFPQHGRDRETLLRRADAAMYAAKRAEPGTLRIYDESHDVAAKAKTTARSELRKAIDDEAFRLHYQPKVDIGSGRLVGFEALVRWPLADGSLRPPNDFIPLAESTGLIVPMGRWIIRQAMADLASFHKIRPDAAEGITMAINLSARQFLDPGLIDLIKATMEAAQVPPDLVQLELTESLIMERGAGGRSQLEALRALGVSIAVDDFGTGYSSLAYLHLLPIDALKIDRSFVKDLDLGGSASVITRGIVNLAKSLGLVTVAEGVETEAQLEQLRAIGCDQFQGFLFSTAKPFDEAARLIT